METLSLGIPFMAAFLNPGGWGADFTWWMDHYTHLAGMWLVGEDMPRETNRVTLNNAREGPVGQRRCRTCTSTTTTTTSPCATTPSRQGERVYKAAGRDQDLPHAAVPVDAQPGHLPHERQCGRTACATSGARRTTSPTCSSRDGSQFTTGGAENPTLTIVTLAIRQAEYIARQMTEKTI